MSDIELIRACKLWDKITEKMNNKEYRMPEELEHEGTNEPYSSGDFSPLKCRIDGKRAELTVGSSPGHRVHVDLEKGALDYYDDDLDPNQAINDLLEEAGLKCRIEHDGVKCQGLKKENVQEAFKVLAMPTSMDFRLKECKSGGVSDDDKWISCRDQCAEELGSNYTMPDGCDCSTWEDNCAEQCVENWENGGRDSDECIGLEKKFFQDGPKKEELTSKEANILPKSQKKLGEFF